MLGLGQGTCSSTTQRSDNTYDTQSLFTHAFRAYCEGSSVDTYDDGAQGGGWQRSTTNGYAKPNPQGAVVRAGQQWCDALREWCDATGVACPPLRMVVRAVAAPAHVRDAWGAAHATQQPIVGEDGEPMMGDDGEPMVGTVPASWPVDHKGKPHTVLAAHLVVASDDDDASDDDGGQ